MRGLLFSLALLASTACAQDDLSITWIGQSCFVLRTAGGPTVITDPPAPSVGYTLGNLTADAVPSRTTTPTTTMQRESPAHSRWWMDGPSPHGSR